MSSITAVRIAAGSFGHSFAKQVNSLSMAAAEADPPKTLAAGAPGFAPLRQATAVSSGKS
jgi:hypothetical protein